jgi:hypothetical protein
MTKREKIAAHFQVPVDTIRYVNGQGWWYSGRSRPILLGKSYYEIQDNPDSALKKIT